jgi:hypothetical protein
MKKTAIALVLLLTFSGCFQIEQSINLEKNLSGTADFHLGINFEPMVVVMAQFAREMEGKKGPLTVAELKKAKDEFKKQSKDKSKSDPPPTLAEMNKDMPEGVKLLDFKVAEKDFGMASDFKFGFDKLSQLVNVKLAQKEGGDPTQKNLIDTPFEGLELIEKGNTITLQTKAINPSEKVEKEAAEAPKMDKDTEKLMKDAFKDLRVVYRITAPFTVVSHNATRKEGNTLIWEYDMARFEEMEKTKKLDDVQVRVTYRR